MYKKYSLGDCGSAARVAHPITQTRTLSHSFVSVPVSSGQDTLLMSPDIMILMNVSEYCWGSGEGGTADWFSSGAL